MSDNEKTTHTEEIHECDTCGNERSEAEMYTIGLCKRCKRIADQEEYEEVFELVYDECKHLFIYYEGGISHAFELLTSNYGDQRLLIFQRICKEKPSFYKDFILPRARKLARDENAKALEELNKDIERCEEAKEKQINEIRSNKRKKNQTKQREIDDIEGAPEWMVTKKRKFEEAIEKQDV